MRVRNVVFVLIVCVLSVSLASSVVAAQAPAKPAAPAQGAAAQAPQIHGSLIQVMRGILFINSNIVFAAQSEDPETIEPDEFLSLSPSALKSLYGKWMAVENAGIAMAEAANLLTIPGRRCSNGRPVPLQDPKWGEWVQGLRDAGMASFKAAQSRSQDAIVEVSETLTVACANCHERYRDVEPIINRCR